MNAELTKKKNIIQFMQRLSAKDSVDGLLYLLYEEISKFKNVKNIFLLHWSYDRSLKLTYTQQKTIKTALLNRIWSKSLRLRVNDLKDSKYLAEEIKRPVGKLIGVPVELAETILDNDSLPIVFYFEHDLSGKKLEEFVNFLDGRISFLSKTLEKIFVENYLKETSLLWESTFNAINDPIAIIDKQLNIKRANSSFSDIGDNYKCPQILEHTDVDCGLCASLKAIELKRTVRSKIKINHRIYDVCSFPVITEEGEVNSFVNHYIDVTRAHELQGQMIQNEKMSALGHLAGNIAHSLNNPLTGLRSMAQVLLSEVDEADDIYSDLIEVEKASLRSQAIINNLLDFSKGNNQQNRKEVSLSELVRTTLPFLKSVLYKFRYEFNLLESQEDLVLVVPDLFKQVIFNIINNACQATPEGGEISVEVELSEQSVLLQVQDTGCGMSDEVQARIFESFFTTKKEGKGTGLGLSMSSHIVKSAGGSISVFSEEGKGTRFQISLPRVGP